MIAGTDRTVTIGNDVDEMQHSMLRFFNAHATV
jgi:hypothetical protein